MSSQNILKTSENGIQLIMKNEGFRAKPYNDAVGHATIGYGTLLHKGNVTPEDLKKYPNGITQDGARVLLIFAVRLMEISLLRAVKVPLTQNQFDSLMCWTYNMGAGRLVEANCTWLRELNKGNYAAVAPGLMKWNKAADGSGAMIELAGLTKRRKEEGNLFNSALA